MGLEACNPTGCPCPAAGRTGREMTVRLYYDNPALREFDARIVARDRTERGPAVQLDQTAFYPTSGGQPFDTGRLGDVAVLDVWEDAAGEVWHLLEAAQEQDAVHGVIDWPRRFDHMQQHSGQHLLSAGLFRLLEAQTIGFHLGAEESTIDLDLTELSWDSAFDVEADVNRVIWENRPFEIHAVNEEEIHQVPLRKAPQVSGTIRVIWVPDYDASACGGTHVARTGAVGMVKITRIERYKGGIRVGFVTGKRALHDYQQVLRGMQAVSTDLSVGRDELADAVGRLQSEVKESRRELKAARGVLNELEAERLLAETADVDGVRLIAAHLEDSSFEDARAVAADLGSRPGIVVLFAVSEAKGTRLVCKRSDDLPDVDAAAILGRAAEQLGGRGGGTANLAQGGAPSRTVAEIERALDSAINRI